MKYLKITKVWSVKAETEDEAVRLIDSDSQEYLESESANSTLAVSRDELVTDSRPPPGILLVFFVLGAGICGIIISAI